MSGFSLYEILMTLAIALILIAFAIPSEHYFLAKASDDRARAQLLHAIEMTRNEAMLRHETITLCKSLDAKTCQGPSWESGYIIHSLEQILYVFQPIQNAGVIYWRAFPAQLQSLSFSPTGSTNAENGTFWYCRPHESTPRWSIIISQTGRVRVIDKNMDQQDLKCKT